MIDINRENVVGRLSRKFHVTIDLETNPIDFRPVVVLWFPFTVRCSFPPLLANARLSFFEQSSLLPGPSDVSDKKCRKKKVGGEKKVGETL